MTSFVLPGMGATSAMYGEAWRRLPDTTFLDWPAYRGESTIGEVADRVIEEAEITESDLPMGSSLGGMVALEIAAKLGAKSVVLIGSARAATEVRTLLRLAAPLAAVTPVRWVQLLAGSSSHDVARQFAGSDPAFLSAMCSAIADWQAPDYAGTVVRVHGTRDHVIPCPDEAHRIEGAGHLLALTHQRETVNAVRARIESAARE